jgi:WD40 repeat protein
VPELLPWRSFERLGRERPCRLLDWHPDGQLVALQTSGGDDSRAGVWNGLTGKLIWSSDDTIALCWMPGGQQVAMLTEHYERSLDHPEVIGSPLQSEFGYYLERRSWPKLERVRVCEIAPPAGWLDSLAISPRGDLVAFSWNEQDCAGVELVALRPDGDEQLTTRVYQTDASFLVWMTFSPDERYLVITKAELEWWTVQGDPPSSPGGHFTLGTIVVYDIEQASFREEEIETDVPADWHPPDSNNIDGLLLDRPRFLDCEQFVIVLPTGEERRFNVRGR